MTRIEFYGNLNKYKDNEKKNEDSELMHYGTIGQKWGVRKWQNYDGTFNEAGKERYFGSKKAMEDQKVSGNFWNQTKARTFMNITDQGRVKHIKKYADYFDIDGLSDDDILKVVRMTPEIDPYNASSYADRINANLYKYKVNNAMTKAANTYSENNQKVGSLNSYLNEATNWINANEVAKERVKQDALDSLNDEDKNQMSGIIMKDNFARLDRMARALEKGKTAKYEKLLNKFKEEDRDLVDEYVKKIEDGRKKNFDGYMLVAYNDNKNKIGSISNPHIKQKYLNEDGTLNENGKARLDSKKTQASVSSAVFKMLKWLHIGSAGAMAPVAITLAAIEAPTALIVASLANIGISGVRAVGDAIISKKLENRASNYYKMLNKIPITPEEDE